MQTTLDVAHHPVTGPHLLLATPLGGEHIASRLEALGWQQGLADLDLWGRTATPEAAVAVRRLLGKGLLVTQAAGDWYRAAMS